MAIQFSNAFKTTITEAIDAAATVIKVGLTAGLHPNVPRSAAAGDTTYLTLVSSDGLTREIVVVTSVDDAAKTVTVTRAQEGTVARAWDVGTGVEQRLTAGSLRGALDERLGRGDTAISANKLAAARTISITGQFRGSTSFDGSGNVAIDVTANAGSIDPSALVNAASGTFLARSGAGAGAMQYLSLADTRTLLSISNVENKSSATIRAELTAANVTAALGFSPQASGNYIPVNAFLAPTECVRFNSTWGNALQVGGNIQPGVPDNNHATIATTNGNLHIDTAAIGGDKQTYINYYRGAELLIGVGNASNVAASFNSLGMSLGYRTGATNTVTSFKMDNTYGNFGDSQNLKIALFRNGTQTYGFGLNGLAGIEHHATAPEGNHTFFVNGNRRATIDNGALTLESGSPTIYMKDTDQRSAAIHVNSSTFYILRGDDTKTTWTQLNGYWPLYINLDGDMSANFGGDVYSKNRRLLHSFDNVAMYRGEVSPAGADGIATTGIYRQNNGGDTSTILHTQADGSTSRVQERFHYNGTFEYRTMVDNNTWSPWKYVYSNRDFTVDISPTANTVMKRNEAGYAFAVYFHTSSPNNENATVDQVITTHGLDGYYRKASIGHFAQANAKQFADHNAGVSRFYSTGGAVGGVSGDNVRLQVYSNDASGAVMSFHRNGVAAVNMGLDNDGIFRIGGWSWAASRLQLDPAGGLTMSGWGDFQTPNDGSTGGVRIRQGSHGYCYLQFINATANAQLAWLRVDGAGSMAVSGSFTASGDVTAFSDARLKTNVRPIRFAREIVGAMRGVRFEKDGREGIGLIAQEVRKLVPEAVHENADGMLSVAYGNLVGVLVEAIKDLQLRVSELEAA